MRATEHALATRLADSAAHPIERARQRIRDAIRLSVADPRAAGVLASLAVGDQAAIWRGDGICSAPPASRIWSASAACM